MDLAGAVRKGSFSLSWKVVKANNKCLEGFVFFFFLFVTSKSTTKV